MKPPSSRLYSLLPPLVRPVSTFSTLLPRTWVGRSTRRFTRRSSSSAPRKMTRCVYPVYCCNISTCLIFFSKFTLVPLEYIWKKRKLTVFGGWVCSVFPSSVSTVSRSAQRTPRVRNNTFSSAPGFEAIPVRLSRSRSRHQRLRMASRLRMDTLLPPMDRQRPRQELAQAQGEHFPRQTVP